MNLAHSLGICGIYALSSMFYSFTMKFLFKVFHFQNASMLLTLEALTDVVISSLIMIKKEKKIYDLTVSKEKDSIFKTLQKFWTEKLKNSRHTFPLSLLHLLSMLCSIKGLEKVSIPMFLALRRSLVLFVLVANWLMGSRKSIKSSIFVSIIFITMGALIAGWQDLNNNWIGYLYVIINNILTASMLQLSKSLYDEMKFEPINIVYNNSMSVLPILIIYVIGTQNFEAFPTLEGSYQSEFLFCLALVCVLSSCHHYMIFYCNNSLSPFAIALTHNFKDILSTSAGIILFQDVVINKYLIGGLLVSFSGAFLYSYSKITEIQGTKIEDIKKENDKVMAIIEIGELKTLNSEIEGKKGD